MTDKTAIGDRIKSYEAASTARIAHKGQPLIARLDGKAFHTFCKGLKRPFDERLSEVMARTMVKLVDFFCANVGYTQSDEITLAWYLETDATGQYPFGGRFQKMDSLMAACTTSWFTRMLPEWLPEKAEHSPVFDCRTFVVPSLMEAYNVFLWRQQDATKNAIAMAAQSMFSHNRLHGLHGGEMQELMFAEKGVNFNDYPAFFKRGVFAKRVQAERYLTVDQLEAIPEKYRPVGPVVRHFVDRMDLWLGKDRVGVDALFGGSGT